MEVTKELALAGFIEKQLEKFEIKEENLRALVLKFNGLTIKGIEDKDGYKAVHGARMELKTERVRIEKTSKSLRARATSFNKAVIEREGQLTSILMTREEEFQRMEDLIDEEKERIRIEEDKAEDKRIQAMSDKLTAVGAALDWITIKGMDDDQFEAFLQESTYAFTERKKKEEGERVELARKREEEQAERLRVQEANRIESERLAKVQSEQDQKAQELQAQQDRIRKEQELLKKQRLDARKQKLFDTGLRLGQSGWDFDSVMIHDKDLMMWADLQDIEFNILIDRLVDDLGRMKKRKEEAEVAEKERIRLQAIKDQEEENMRLQKEREERERVAEEERIEKLNASSDIDKFATMGEMIHSFMIDSTWPVFKSKKGEAGAQVIREHLRSAWEECTKRTNAKTPK